MIKTTLLAAAIGIATLIAAPVHAGGPVIVEDTTVDQAEPARKNWLVPVIIGGIILCASACDSGDDPEPTKPTDPSCQGGCK